MCCVDRVTRKLYTRQEISGSSLVPYLEIKGGLEPGQKGFLCRCDARINSLDYCVGADAVCHNCSRYMSPCNKKFNNSSKIHTLWLYIVVLLLFLLFVCLFAFFCCNFVPFRCV